jgi:hypothetical protein
MKDNLVKRTYSIFSSQDTLIKRRAQEFDVPESVVIRDIFDDFFSSKNEEDNTKS